MSKFIWMKVTDDEYELPVAVADSSVDLAKICGTTPESIRNSIQNAKTGRNGAKRTPYRVIKLKGSEVDE